MMEVLDLACMVIWMLATKNLSFFAAKQAKVIYA